MNIGYFEKWVEQCKVSGQFPASPAVISVSTFEDMLMIVFKQTDWVLHLHYGNVDIMPFWSRDIYGYLGKTSAFSSFLQHTTMIDYQLYGNDKILQFSFSRQNIYNQKEELLLIFEMIARYQNLILCRKVNDKLTILDCMKKITFADQHTRQILPGAVYQPPVTSYVHTAEDIGLPIIAGDRSFTDINEFFAYKYSLGFDHKIESLKRQVVKTYEKELKKAQNKLQKQLTELQSAKEIEYWQQCVELMKASFHLLEPGQQSVCVPNYFATGDALEDFPEIEIKLNPAFSVQKNLDFYVKKYRKALSGQKIIAANIQKTEKEIAHLQQMISTVALYTDYSQIKSFIAESRSKSATDKEKKLFRVLPISEEWEILIGRSNKENDILTCKTAKPDDWWFHTRIFHGTHVVLRNFLRKTPPDELIILCSALAAYYSRAKNSTNVPVDYTQIRYVTKPRGASPGYVVYKNQKTFYANPMSIREAGGKVIRP